MEQFYSFSKKRFLLLMSLWVLIITSGYSQQTVSKTVNNVKIDITTPQTLQTCANASIHIVMTNTGGTAVNNFDLVFLNNTKIDMLYSNLVNSNITNDVSNNKIIINSIAAGDNFSFDLPIRANCSNFINSTDPTNTTAQGTLTIRPLSVAASDFAFTYTIQSGFLEYISVDDAADNIFYQGHKGDVFTRKYNMKSTSTNVYIGTVFLEEVVTDNITINTLRVNVGGTNVYTIPSPTVNPITKKIQYSFDVTIPTGKMVEIFEDIVITGCPISTGNLILKHGCSNDVCKELEGVSSNFQVVIARGPEKPDLVWEDLNPIDYNTCLSSNNNITRSFKLKNNGGAYAENIAIDFSVGLYPESNNLMLVPNSSFGYTTSNSAIQLTTVSEQLYTMDYIQNQLLPNNGKMEYNNCFSSATDIISKKKYIINKLLPGQSITFYYSPKICCIKKGVTTSIIADDGFNTNFYDDECNQNILYAGIVTSDAGAINPGMSQFPTSLVNNMYGCKDCGGAPNCFGNPTGNCLDATLNNGTKTDFTDEIRIKSTGIEIRTLPMDIRKFRIAVDVAADGSLMLAPPGTTGNPIGNVRLVDSKGVIYTPVSQSVLLEASVKDIFGTTDFPTTEDNYIGARTYFEFTYTDIFNDPNDIINFDNYGYKYINYTKLNQFLSSLEIRFEVSGKCGRSPSNTGPSNYFERMYLEPNTDCQDCLFPIGELSRQIIVNCPGCVFPGVITSKYEVERVTVGFNDGDNNGLRDLLGNIPSGTNINNNANLKMVTDNDIFKTTTKSDLWGGSGLTYGAGAVYGSLEDQPGFAHRFLNNMCRLDKFSAHTGIFSVVVDATHPIKVDYFRNGSPLFSVSFTSNVNNVTSNLNYISSTDGNGNFLLQLPIDLVRDRIGLPTFNYEASDAFEITCYYQITGTFDLGKGKYYDNLDIINRCYFSGNSDPSVIIVKDVNNTDESNPASPYGLSGSITDPSLLTPSLNYICEGYGSGLILADIKEEYTFGRSGLFTNNGNNCVKSTGAAYGIMSDVKDYLRTDYLYDLFPYEVRNFSKVKKFQFIVPQGYVLDVSNSFLRSEFSYRQPSDYDYSRIYLTKSLSNVSTSNLVIVNSAYTDHVYGLMGVLYEASFDFENAPYYYNNGFTLPCPTCTDFMLSANESFPDYNEFVEQVLYIYIKPNCASPNPHDYVDYNDNSTMRAAIASSNGNVIDGIKGEVVSFDNLNNNYNTALTQKSCTDPDCFAQFYKPDAVMSLVKLQPNIIITKKNQRIPFRISVDKDASKVFAYFTSSNNQFQFNNVYVNGSSTPLQIQNGVYQLGNLNAGSVDFEIETQYVCNNNNQAAQFMIHYGYDCDNYPTFDGTQLSKITCNLNTDVINVSLSTANMEISYSTNLGAIPCDEIDHSLTIKSLGQGDIYLDQANNNPVDISISLPANLSFTNGSAVLTAYNIDGTIMQDASNTNIQVNLPDPSRSGTIYTWSITGYPILDNIDLNLGKYLVLTFKTDPTCLFTGGQVNATANLISYCSDKISKSLSPSYNLVFTENCTPFSANLTGPLALCKGTSASLSYQITSTTATAGNYHLSWEINGVPVAAEDISVSTYPFLATGNFNLDSYNGNTAVHLKITNAEGCFVNDNITIVVNPIPTVSINNLSSDYCQGSPSVSLTGTPSGGVFSGSNVVGNTFTPLTSGTSSISYSYTDLNGCSATATKAVTVHNLPVPVITGLLSSYCQNSAPVILSATPSGGVFSGTTVTNGIFTPSQVGIETILYSYTDAFNCTGTAQATTTIKPLPVLTLNGDTAYCQNEFIIRSVTVSGVSAPYTYQWYTKAGTTKTTIAGQTSSALTNVQIFANGVYGVTVTGGGCSSSIESLLTLKAASVCCRYKIGDITTICGSGATSFCVPLTAVIPVDAGIIGMDYCLSYNPAHMTPTGVATLGPVVTTTSALGSYYYYNDAVNGKVHVSIYYKSNAPLGTNFKGKGDVICIGFTANASLAAGVIDTLKSCELQEAYTLYEKAGCWKPGVFKVTSDTDLRGELRYMNTTKVLSYTPLLAPTNVNYKRPTNIYTAENNCDSIVSGKVFPDGNGDFTLSLLGKNNLSIVRDIANNYTPSHGTQTTTNFNFMRYVNGLDANRVGQITTLNGAFLPNGLQITAADVNMNGRVRANDITLMQQRTVAIIQEFPQVWNYDLITNTPIAGKGLSLDWRFIDKTTYDATAKFKPSAAPSAYPAYDGKGFYRDDLPVIPFCLPAKKQCKSDPRELYYGILLGDVVDLAGTDPNTGQASFVYPIKGDSRIRMATEAVAYMTLDLGAAKYLGNNTYEVPLGHTVPSQDTLVSIDFGMNYDETKLEIVDVNSLFTAQEEIDMVWNDYRKSELLLTSYTLNKMKTSGSYYSINMRKADGNPISKADIGATLGLLNGYEVEVRLSGATTAITEANSLTIEPHLWVVPTPAKGQSKIEYALMNKSKTNRIVITNAIGQVVKEYNNLPELGSIEFDADMLAAGLYFCTAYGEEAGIQIAKFTVIK